MFYCKHHKNTLNEWGWSQRINCIVDCLLKKPCEKGHTAYEQFGYSFELDIDESRRELANALKARRDKGK